MANYFDTGILLTAGFSLSSQAPLDGRSVVELLTDLDTHIAENRAYEGMCVYVKENKKIYIYNGTTWEEFVGGGSSEKQIKDWVSGSSYLEGDYIYHEGEIYRCLTSNNDVDFDETNWKKLTYGIDELSKEDVERLLGLTKEEIEAMADLISDTEVKIDKTYSSYKIYTAIQDAVDGITVPTKTSDLTNDSGFITSIPSEYITETELETKGYLTSHQDISGLQTKTDDNLTTTSKEVVGAINEVKDKADLILDTEARIDKTYSSSKIYADIQQCLEDSKTYTLEELGKKFGASYEVVTSTDDMVSQDRLYLLNNDNSYDIYIVDVDNIPIVIGDTTIDLSNYYNKTEIDEKLVAEFVSYDNESLPSVTNVEECLNAIIAKIYYVNPSVTSFTCNPSKTAYEIGEKVTSVTFTWTYNKDMVSQTLTGCDLADETVRTATYSTEFNSNKTFTLSASDGTNSTSANKAFTFQNKVHHGSASIPSTYDSAFILSLNGALKGSKGGTYTTTVGSGEYFYIAMPTSFNNSDVLTGKIGGFDTDFGKVATIQHTNASGYTTSYNIYKSTNSNLGSISMVI